MINRRKISGQALAALLLAPSTFSFTSYAKAENIDFAKILGLSEKEILLLAQTSDQAELKDLVAHGVAVAGLRDRVKSKRIIADRAIALIVASEVTSKTIYQKKYQGIIWPKQGSGPTIGIGYDFGQVSRNNFDEDWKDYLDEAMIAHLYPLCGVKGKDSVAAIKAIATPPKIEFDLAYKQFIAELLPRYTDELEHNLENCAKLNDKQLGALVSLSFNRGFSYHKSGPRYQEMRNIASHMAKSDFSLIPAEFRKMPRIWKGQDIEAGMKIRREVEAKMFEEGLK
jgi:GH24 family phage-related lysozyme (muramidase)